MIKQFTKTILFCLLMTVLAFKTTDIYAETNETSTTIKIDDVITFQSIPYKVLSLDENRGTLQIGDGERPIINTAASFTIPKQFTHQNILFTVTEIGSNAFSGQDVQVEEINIPATVIKIQESAFARSERLRSVVFEANSILRTIENEAFSGAESLETIENIPNTLEEIKIYAFNDAHNLRSFVLSSDSKLRKIDEGAFVNAYELSSFFIPKTVREIAVGAFQDTKKLREFIVDPHNQNYRSIDGVLFNKEATELIQYALAKENKDYQVPTGVKVIKHSAFAKNKNIVNLNLGDTLTTIESRAFHSMVNLKTIIFPQTLQEIGRNSFAKSTKILKIILPNHLPKLQGFTFDTLSGLQLIYIGENTNRLDSGAFRGDSSQVKKVIIASENISIDPQAFSFIRRNDVEYIVKNEAIKNQLLKHNKNLTNIIVKENIESTDLLLEDEKNQTDQTLSIGQIIEKDGIVYKVLSVDGLNATVQVGDGINPVGIGMLSLTIPSIFNYQQYQIAIKQLGRKSFSSSSTITTLNLPEGLVKIGMEAFMHNNKIRHLSLPNTVLEIGLFAFQNATALESIELSNNLQTIRSSAFESVPNLSELHIPDSVIKIENGGLSNLVGLKKLYVGQGMQTIGAGFINGRFLALEFVRFANPDITLEVGSVPLIEVLDFNVIVTSKKAQQAVMHNLDLDENRVYVENERRFNFLKDNVVVLLNPNEQAIVDTISVVKPKSYSHSLDEHYVLDVYDIDLKTMNNETVKMQNVAKLKLPIQTGKTPIKVFYLPNENTQEELVFEKEDNYVVVDAHHFSKYAVAYQKPNTKPIAPIVNDKPSNSLDIKKDEVNTIKNDVVNVKSASINNNQQNTLPQTGSTNSYHIQASMILFIAVFIIKKKVYH